MPNEEVMSGSSPVCPRVSAADWMHGFLLKLIIRYYYKIGGTSRFVSNGIVQDLSLQMGVSGKVNNELFVVYSDTDCTFHTLFICRFCSANTSG
jgi:hypothetical protein